MEAWTRWQIGRFTTYAEPTQLFRLPYKFPRTSSRRSSTTRPARLPLTKAITRPTDDKGRYPLRVRPFLKLRADVDIDRSAFRRIGAYQ